LRNNVVVSKQILKYAICKVVREKLPKMKIFNIRDPIKWTFQRLYHHQRLAQTCFQQPHVKSDKTAIYDNIGSHSYNYITHQSDKISRAISRTLKIQGSNVAFLTPNNHQYILAQWAIWKSGYSCVPLCKNHPPETLKYYIQDSKVAKISAKTSFIRDWDPWRVL
jgi:long-subunit acyl-CoA synthetase (AMP-forming)